MKKNQHIKEEQKRLELQLQEIEKENPVENRKREKARKIKNIIKNLELVLEEISDSDGIFPELSSHQILH